MFVMMTNIAIKRLNLAYGALIANVRNSNHPTIYKPLLTGSFDGVKVSAWKNRKREVDNTTDPQQLAGFQLFSSNELGMYGLSIKGIHVNLYKQLFPRTSSTLPTLFSCAWRAICK